MSVTVFPAPATGGKTLKTDIITSTQSWTAPAGVTTIELLLVGGGGGGGGTSTTTGHGGGGGGGGGVIQDTLAVTPGTSYTVTIGAGGAAGSGASGPGGTGSSSSFGSLRTCFGGLGGWSSNNTYPSITSVSSGSGQGTNTPSYPAGAGGGANPFATFNSGTTTIVWFGSNWGFKIKQGTPGYAASNSNVGIEGNYGVNGYGCGGGGGSYNGVPGGVNAGDGANQLGNATAPRANTGSGGGGAYMWSSAFAASAGSAGIAIIKYWS